MSAILLFFFFNDTATTEIYTLSLHDALPIWELLIIRPGAYGAISITSSAYTLRVLGLDPAAPALTLDRKSTRLNSSHGYISYAVFCLKKKKKKIEGNNMTLGPQSDNVPDS